MSGSPKRRVFPGLGCSSHSSGSPLNINSMVNNINQPLEISAISSPEQSGRSPCGQDLDQPPVLKRERPLELNNTGRYSSAPSSDEEGNGYAPDTSSSSRIERKIATISLDRDGPVRDLERGLQGRKSGASSVSSEVSSSSGTSKWKSTFSPISDPKPTPPDIRQGGSPFSVGASRGGTDSDSDHKPQRRGEREREPYGNSNLFLSQDGSGRSAVNTSERSLQKQKVREWDLKSVSGLASQNLFISAAASGGILSGKVGGAATVSSASAVGQYFPLGGASVLQPLFGTQAAGPATSGAPRLVNGHSALGSFSSAGLAGGAAGGN